MFITQFNWNVLPGFQECQTQCSLLPGDLSSEPVRPPSCVVTLARWVYWLTFRQHNRQNILTQLTPDGVENAPASLRPQMLQCAHTVSLARDSIHTWMLENIRSYFCWSTIQDDVAMYVAACVACAAHKSHHRHPQGLLLPLPIPHQPWSHVTMN